jgi:hypothetical protein
MSSLHLKLKLKLTVHCTVPALVQVAYTLRKSLVELYIQCNAAIAIVNV